MTCHHKKYIKDICLKLTPIITISCIIILALFINNRVAKAAKLADGVWTQSASPGTTTITFTNGGTILQSGYKIIFTFPSTAAINAAGTNIAITGSTTPIRVNSAADNTITVTLDGSIAASAAVTCTMTDALTGYTNGTYSQESLALNSQTNLNAPIDFGVAIKTNANTTTVTASVPLFVNMAVNTTTISLGTLSTASVKTASQTYTVNSNNQSGVTLQVSTDGLLNDGNGNDINYVADGTVSAGSEEYGIAAVGTNLTVNANYNTGDNDLIQAANPIATSTGTVSNATLALTYKASIAGTTVSGAYEQVVTVTIATNA